MARQSHPRVSPVAAYDYTPITALQASRTKIGAASGGSFLGKVVVNNKGSGCVLTLFDGSTAVAIVNLDTVSLPLIYEVELVNGLYYTLTGSVAPSLLMTYLDCV